MPRSYRFARTAKPSPRRRAFRPVLEALEDRLAPSRFAVISDYGQAGASEQHVADLVHGFNPDFVQTLGDNNYPHGEASTIDINIGLSQRAAGYAATRYLLDLGHRRIGAIAARLDARSRSRAEGYRRAMAEAGLGTEGLIAMTPQRSRAAPIASATVSTWISSMRSRTSAGRC